MVNLNKLTITLLFVLFAINLLEIQSSSFQTSIETKSFEYEFSSKGTELNYNLKHEDVEQAFNNIANQLNISRVRIEQKQISEVVINAFNITQAAKCEAKIQNKFMSELSISINTCKWDIGIPKHSNYVVVPGALVNLPIYHFQSKTQYDFSLFMPWSGGYNGSVCMHGEVEYENVGNNLTLIKTNDAFYYRENVKTAKDEDFEELLDGEWARNTDNEGRLFAHDGSDSFSPTLCYREGPPIFTPSNFILSDYPGYQWFSRLNQNYQGFHIGFGNVKNYSESVQKDIEEIMRNMDY